MLTSLSLKFSMYFVPKLSSPTCKIILKYKLFSFKCSPEAPKCSYVYSSCVFVFVCVCVCVVCLCGAYVCLCGAYVCVSVCLYVGAKYTPESKLSDVDTAGASTWLTVRVDPHYGQICLFYRKYLSTPNFDRCGGFAR